MDPREPDAPQPPPPPTQSSAPIYRTSYGQAKELNPLPSLSIALSAVLLFWVPVVGLVFGALTMARAFRVMTHPRGDGLAAGFVLLLGLGATVFGLGSTVLGFAILSGSCPHVYSFDGARFQLDADPLSGALFAGAEREDWDRLEHLQPVEGRYRLRVVNELKEIDHIDALSLRIVDHEPGIAVLPSPSGELWSVREAVPPQTAVDSHGRDVRAALTASDDVAESGRAHDFAAQKSDPRERLTLTFARPAGPRALLWLRAHSTPFAEEAYVHYMATMGPGAGVLMRWAQSDTDYPYAQRVADEARRLGLPLTVHAVGTGAVVELGPIGPAIQRDFVVPLPLPASGDTVTIELSLTPLFWEIDQARLAVAPAGPLPGQLLQPESVQDHQGRSLLPLLRDADGQRVRLQNSEYIEAGFVAPPTVAGTERTVVLAIRGFYEMDFGGRGWLNPLALVAHRLGYRSLPRFALQRALDASH